MRQVLLHQAISASGLFRVQEVGKRQALLSAARQGCELQLELPIARPEFGASAEVLMPGDVVRVAEGARKVHVCFRASDRHHTLFVTNQCNSRCLMCSQPPTAQDDAWLFDEAMEIVSLVEEAPSVVGITGGEPTLHPLRLRALLDFIHARWPSTQVEILTNARRLGDQEVSSLLLEGLPAGRTRWLTPLYGACDEVHDFVVQSPGAFDETVAGLLNLQRHRQQVQLRTVLIRPVVDQLSDWAEFVGRNLPFVETVALMATEPIGFALANEDMSLVDASEFAPALMVATELLSSYRLRPVLMNMPLCKLPEKLRPLAAMSISDWKNSYAPECNGCALQPRCAGFFVWDKTSLYRTGIKPVQGAIHA